MSFAKDKARTSLFRRSKEKPKNNVGDDAEQSVDCDVSKASAPVSRPPRPGNMFKAARGVFKKTGQALKSLHPNRNRARFDGESRTPKCQTTANVRSKVNVLERVRHQFSGKRAHSVESIDENSDADSQATAETEPSSGSDEGGRLWTNPKKVINRLKERRQSQSGMDATEDYLVTATAMTCLDREPVPMPPSPGAYGCAHLRLNHVRAGQNVRALRRSIELDKLARIHAAAVARKRALVHSAKDPEQLRRLLRSACAAENIQRGKNVGRMIRSLSKWRGQTPAGRIAMSEDFDEVGLGTARSQDGRLYMVTLFRSSEHVLLQP